MERKIINYLNRYYYGCMILAVLLATGAYYVIMKSLVMAIDPQSVMGRVVQSILILDVLVTIPLGLWLHKRTCRRISPMEDKEAQAEAYCRSARLRILLVSNTMVWGGAAFYLLGAYQSLLWLTAISVIGWYFTKPTEKKMFYELLPDE